MCDPGEKKKKRMKISKLSWKVGRASVYFRRQLDYYYSGQGDRGGVFKPGLSLVPACLYFLPAALFFA